MVYIKMSANYMHLIEPKCSVPRVLKN